MIALLSIALAQEPDLIVAGSEDAGPEIAVDLGSKGRMVLSGYLDIGWFDAQGDGVAYRRQDDLPDRSVAWGFTGDPWANAINSLGESADLGTDTTTTLDRYDPVDSNGNPSFLVNQWHQGVDVSVGERLLVRGAIKVAPRSGQLGSPGDAIWADTAYVEWIPVQGSDLRVTAGKIESIFGREYRSRQSPDRYGITPSLIARYTTGTPVGIKARGSVDQVFWYAVGITNAGAVTERFGHFSHDIDDDGMPTGTSRLAVQSHGRVGIEAGVSGQISGPEAGDPTELPHAVGADLGLDVGPAELRGEILRTRYPRGLDGEALDANGWRLEVSAQPVPRVRPFVRVDRRNARLITGPNLYNSDVIRLTGAIRVDPTPQTALKVEYLHLRELRGPEIPDDVVTTSAVFRY